MGSRDNSRWQISRDVFLCMIEQYEELCMPSEEIKRINGRLRLAECNILGDVGNIVYPFLMCVCIMANLDLCFLALFIYCSVPPQQFQSVVPSFFNNRLPICVLITATSLVSQESQPYSGPP